MEWSHFLSKSFFQLLHDFHIFSIRIIHVGNKKYSWNLSSLTNLPSLNCSNFDSRLAIYNNNCCISNTHCIFHLTHKIKISRCVKNVNLQTIPLYRYNWSIYGKLSFNLLLIIITDSITVLHPSHSGNYSCRIRNSFCQSSLSWSSVTKKNNISNTGCFIYVHNSGLLI